MKQPVEKPACLFEFNQAAAMLKPTIPGPDPDTKTPKFKLPALATDAHCHIFGPHENIHIRRIVRTRRRMRGWMIFASCMRSSAWAAP